jgi:hypothetical protein
MSISNAAPVFAVDEKNLVPVSDHLQQMMDIPPSRMFLINKSLKVYQEKNPGAKIFDASQGDGGASLPGVPRRILERAAELQIEHGTAYDMPFGTDAYRKVVIEQYWKLDSEDVMRWSRLIRPCWHLATDVRAISSWSRACPGSRTTGDLMA